MATAMSVEWLKLRRSRMVLVTTAVLAGLLPLAAAGFMAAYLAGGDGQLAAKARGSVHGSTWADYLSLDAQLLSVGALLGVGVVVCWVYGREFAEGTVCGLFALPVSRWQVAWAKAVVVLGWGLATCVLAAVVAVPLGLLIGLDAAAAPEVAAAAVAPVVVAVLTTLLALPLGLVASAGRGYLPGIGALLGVVVLTQVVTTVGAGGWFPWAAPGLWSGMGGEQAATSVTAVQLALPAVVGLLGTAATAWWWRRAEVV